MKATELRIGNLVEYKITDAMDYRKEWWELNPIDVFDLQHLVEYPKDGFFRPIPITEEWMNRLGFKENGAKYNVGIWKMKDFGFWDLKFSKADNRILNVFLFHHKIAEIRFVHQLQNIFFSVTGKELMIDKETFVTPTKAVIGSLFDEQFTEI